MDPRVCIIGCGKMGQAMLSGWLAAENGMSPLDFCIVEHSAEKCEHLHEEYGVDAYCSVKEACSAAGLFRMFILAVKPQAIGEALDDLARSLESDAGALRMHPLVVSIAAGVPTAKISSLLPDGVRIIRVMPNTPLQVRAGASVVAAGPGATQDDMDEVCGMFAQLGMAEAVDESEIDAACALSGGGPAYTALMIEALTSAGAAQGLSRDLAETLAFQTIYGTCKLMEETGSTPEQTRIAVCSPGGTTLAALAAMEGASADAGAGADVGIAADAGADHARSASEGFTGSINRGIAAAVARAKELASC